MKLSSLLALYEKLERLVQRLPEKLQSPIMREITPIKTLFLLQRPPRVVLLGSPGVGKSDLVNTLVGGDALEPSEELLHGGAWQNIMRGGHGSIRVLDARQPVSLSAAQTALASEAPDAYLLLGGRDADEEALRDAVEHAARLIEFADLRHELRPRVLAVQLGPDDLARARLNTIAHADKLLEGRLVGTIAVDDPQVSHQRLAALVAAELPSEAQLEMARLTGNRALQKEIAQVVVKSVSAICGAVGAQPIPLADFPILTSLQASMVAGVMYISGRDVSTRAAGEFTAALGANLGTGLVLREGARAVLKVVPIWGDLVAGGIAAAGTYAVGRAAIAYFIEGVSIKDARGLFRRDRRKKPLLKN